LSVLINTVQSLLDPGKFWAVDL